MAHTFDQDGRLRCAPESRARRWGGAVLQSRERAAGGGAAPVKSRKGGRWSAKLAEPRAEGAVQSGSSARDARCAGAGGSCGHARVAATFGSWEVQSECGVVKASGFSGPMEGTQNGTSYTAASRPTASGGAYEVCWCAGVQASASACTSNAQFSLRLGILFLDGPVGKQRFECTKGVSCLLASIAGYGLEAGDSVVLGRNCPDTMPLHSTVAMDQRRALLLGSEPSTASCAHPRKASKAAKKQETDSKQTANKRGESCGLQ